MTLASPTPRTTRLDDSTDLTLTDPECAEVLRLARELVLVEPRLMDTRVWMDEARRRSSRLPLRLRESVRQYRHDPGPTGLLIVRNLPNDETLLPETPTVAESVERRATTPGAVTALLSLCLGEVVAYREEKSGALVQNVVPVPGQEASQSNAGSGTLLELHVENAFHPHRPDYVGLFCLRNDHSGTAGTLVSSIRRALALVPPEAVGVLLQPRFVTEPPPSFHSGAPTTAHPVLEGAADDPNILVDFSATMPLDDEAKAALEVLRDAFLTVSETLVLQPGELAFVDNRLSVHGRTTFEARYDGRDRWLHRTFVHLDNRRNRSHRSGGGFVLS
ncbi:TauD/TfdA family dioxygenase [Kitasatospora sp. NPDC093558]|uniref:TauD/TfdA family dioxygenase n=1 Tax=Kitasatospora sp. NPDC093558 TaxID=3155201 RepID=UPI00342EE2EC